MKAILKVLVFILTLYAYATGFFMTGVFSLIFLVNGVVSGKIIALVMMTLNALILIPAEHILSVLVSSSPYKIEKKWKRIFFNICLLLSILVDGNIQMMLLSSYLSEFRYPIFLFTIYLPFTIRMIVCLTYLAQALRKIRQ